MENVFFHEVQTDEIITDNEPLFLSNAFERFLKDLGIKYVPTSLHHSRSNSLVDSCNRVIKKIFSCRWLVV